MTKTIYSDDDQEDQELELEAQSPEPINLGEHQEQPHKLDLNKDLAISEVVESEDLTEVVDDEDKTPIVKGNDFIRIAFPDFELTLSSKRYDIFQLSNLCLDLSSKFYKKKSDNKKNKSYLGLG